MGIKIKIPKPKKVFKDLGKKIKKDVVKPLQKDIFKPIEKKIIKPIEKEVVAVEKQIVKLPEVVPVKDITKEINKMGLGKDIKNAFKKAEKTIEKAVDKGIKTGGKVVSTVYKDGVSIVKGQQQAYQNLTGGLGNALSSPMTFVAIGLVALVILTKK